MNKEYIPETLQEFADKFGTYIARDKNGHPHWFLHRPHCDKNGLWKDSAGYKMTMPPLKDSMKYGYRKLITPRTPKELEEMANSWETLRKQVVSGGNVRIEHLVKLFYYRDVLPDFPKVTSLWIDSSYRQISSIAVMKNTKKLPSKEKLFELIWGEWENKFDKIHNETIKMVNAKYNDMPKIKVINNETKKDCKEFCIKYFTQTCEILSKTGEFKQPTAKKIIYSLLGIRGMK